jgi:hypothetical protein
LCVVTLLTLAITACAGNASGGETVTAVDLNRHDPGQTEVGAVTFVAGYELEMDDPAFGGLSGLTLSPDASQLTAVSDQGWWFTARLDHDSSGRLTGLHGFTVMPMLDMDGRALHDLPGGESRTRRDAEGLTENSDGGYLVSFERDHRLWSYAEPSALPIAVELPPAVSELVGNSGLEALVRLADGRLVMFAEEPLEGETTIRGWIRDDDGWRQLAYVPRDAFAVTDMAELADGRIVVLERWFREPAFLNIRLREITPDMLAADAPIDAPVLATFANPLLLDNFEGLAARPAPDGGALLYIVSDDNYNDLQRTLFYQLHLAP